MPKELVAASRLELIFAEFEVTAEAAAPNSSLHLQAPSGLLWSQILVWCFGKLCSGAHSAG